jgi:hypothetical protein
MSRQQRPLTRFGIYKIVKRYTGDLRSCAANREYRGISPHTFRKTVSRVSSPIDAKLPL